MNDLGTEPRFKGVINTNSIFIAIATFIIVASIGWVGKTSADNNDKLTRIETGLPYLQNAVNDLKTQVAGLVTRPELESRIGELKLQQSKLELEILKMQRQAKDGP